MKKLLIVCLLSLTFNCKGQTTEAEVTKYIVYRGYLCYKLKRNWCLCEYNKHSRNGLSFSAPCSEIPGTENLK